jgi:hypothetical protein
MQHFLHLKKSSLAVPNLISLKSSGKTVTLISHKEGRAIAQAVSRWLPTAVARVRARVWSCGICGAQSSAGVGFLRVLRFPLPIFTPLIPPQSTSSIIWGLYNRPEMAVVPSGLSPTPLILIIIKNPTKKNLRELHHASISVAI